MHMGPREALTAHAGKYPAMTPQDGVKLLYGIPYVEDGVYLDTPENRQLLGSYSRDMQRTLTNRKNPHKGYDR